MTVNVKTTKTPAEATAPPSYAAVARKRLLQRLTEYRAIVEAAVAGRAGRLAHHVPAREERRVRDNGAALGVGSGYQPNNGTSGAVPPTPGWSGLADLEIERQGQGQQVRHPQQPGRLSRTTDELGLSVPTSDTVDRTNRTN